MAQAKAEREKAVILVEARQQAEQNAIELTVDTSVTDIFDRIMQEEARHILFIVNWAAYLRARRPLPLRPVFDARRAWNVTAQAFDRVEAGGAPGRVDGRQQGQRHQQRARGEQPPTH